MPVPRIQRQILAETRLPAVTLQISRVTHVGVGDDTESIYDKLPTHELTFLYPHSGSAVKLRFGDSENDSEGGYLGVLVFRPANTLARALGAKGMKGPTQMLICNFDCDYFEEITGLRHWRKEQLAQFTDIPSRPISMLMKRIVSEMLAPRHASTLAIASLIQLVLVEFARHFSEASPRPAPRRMAPWQLKRIDEYFREATYRWPTNSELAKLFGITPKHLSRSFSETVGISLSDYAAQIRVERAKGLLAESRLAVKQIAAMLGFSDASYFSVVFRRATGETPSSFSKKSRASYVSANVSPPDVQQRPR